MANHTYILGGSFDPVHMDHIQIGRHLLRRNARDEVVYLPSCLTVGKHAPFLPQALRVFMLRVALAQLSLEVFFTILPRLVNYRVDQISIRREYEDWYTQQNDTRMSIWDNDLRRGGISYTIDTLQEMRTRPATHTFVLGMDRVKDFAEWKDVTHIFEHANVLVMTRKGVDAMDLPFPQMQRMEFDGHGYSSSQIREHLHQGQTAQAVQAGLPSILGSFWDKRVPMAPQD